MAALPNTKGASAGSLHGRIEIALVGSSHHTAPLELRERLSFTAEQALEASHELRQRGVLEEAVVVSTCNRSELYGVPRGEAPDVTEALRDFIASFHGILRTDLDPHVYSRSGADAVRHLYRVAAGLESMLLGEAEILGQLRSAYGQALDRGLTGPVLNKAFQGALEVGKRVRAETEVGARPMSVALAGVKLAERVFGNLRGRAALIVGAGEVAEQVVEHLRNRQIGSLRVINRSWDRAAELASRMGGEAIAWDELSKVVATPDIIVTSVSSEKPVLTREMLSRALDARGGKPIFIIDLGVPRNVAPEAAGLYNLYLYNIEDLGEIVEQNKRAREAEIPRAEAIIAEHLGRFEAWRAALQAGSIVDELREHFREQRESLLHERLASLENLSAEERQRIAGITEELIERMLREPSERLRNGRGMRGRLGAIEALRHLFALGEKGDGGEDRE